MSGVEIAGSLAFQISSAVNTPGTPPFPEPEKYVVCNVVQKPVWVMPLFFPKDPDVEISEGNVATKVRTAFLDVLSLIVDSTSKRTPPPLFFPWISSTTISPGDHQALFKIHQDMLHLKALRWSMASWKRTSEQTKQIWVRIFQSGTTFAQNHLCLLAATITPNSSAIRKYRLSLERSSEPPLQTQSRLKISPDILHALKT